VYVCGVDGDDSVERELVTRVSPAQQTAAVAASAGLDPVSVQCRRQVDLTSCQTAGRVPVTLETSGLCQASDKPNSLSLSLSLPVCLSVHISTNH